MKELFYFLDLDKFIIYNVQSFPRFLSNLELDALLITRKLAAKFSR